jgi:hypothetical protein
VILGGIVAGIIINISEYCLNGVILTRDWQAAMTALGRTMAPSAIPVFVVWGFLAGISAIALYAMARPRFGAGAKTAVLTGFAFWIFSYLLPNIGQWALNLFPQRLIIIGVAVGLVEVIIGSVAGAALYKEQ